MFEKGFVPIESGFAHLLLLLVFLLLITAGGVVYYLKLNKPSAADTNSTTTASSITTQINNIRSKVDEVAQQPVIAQAIPTPTPVPLWKTYINTKYNFQLIYPRQGMLWAEDAYQAGECGNAIKENAQQSNRILTSFVQEVIQFDSFFEILVLQGPETVDDYINQIGAKDKYDIFSFTGTGADEAVEVSGLKKDAEYAVGYPPLTYISHIFRKGEQLFLVKHFFNPHNLGGCIDPALLDPVAHSHLQIKDWDLKQSFKFN